MALVTAVIIPVKLFIYVYSYTNLIFVENSYKYSNMVQYTLLYFMVLQYVKNWMV